jgi:dihydropteroate synthase
MDISKKSLRCGKHTLVAQERTFIMGIINVTPDSFSDGLKFFTKEAAIEHGLKLIKQGADIIDVGGVSSAPFCKDVSEKEEFARILPVVEGLVKQGVTSISIDTKRASVAKACLALGASWINDQSAGLFDHNMPQVMAQADAVILMHDGGGTTSGVYAGEKIIYQDVISHLLDFFSQRIEILKNCGVDLGRIILDPGVGFGKGLNDTLTIINNMQRFNHLAAMSLIGLSRKSFIEKIIKISSPKKRDMASLGATAAAVFSGVNIIRTHSVKETLEMVRVLNRCMLNKIGGSYNENLY